MGVFGEARHEHQKQRFLVEIDGISYPGFQDCSALKATMQQMEYYEGGSIRPKKRPTRLTVDDITLTRAAVSGDNELYYWFVDVADGAAGTGLPSPQFLRTLDIVQLERDGTVLRRWTVYNAWVKEYQAGEWDGTSDDPTPEQVVLACEYFELTYEK
jgi:phage tail-like protein